ncbi:MAG TPA: histidinol-phosphatase [Candidatus Dormibacteraeota bacterium]|nr:histidinol-phosphatase [Candidatus Dormibacteraeota bacterium]
MSPDLALALELADLADSISLPRFRSRDLRVETKADTSPVTEVDRAVEDELRQRLSRYFPGDAILGEEQGETASGARRRWIIDPIDGTRNYVRGVPAWGTLIALEVEGRLVAGVASAPALGQRWWAARGEGAFNDRGRIEVSTIHQVEDAYISTTDYTGFAKTRGLLDRYTALASRCWAARGLGDLWSHALVAEGSIDIAAEMPVSPWDIAAAKVIVEEAGGRVTDIDGRDRIDTGSVVSSNGRLHDAVIAALRR